MKSKSNRLETNILTLRNPFFVETTDVKKGSTKIEKKPAPPTKIIECLEDEDCPKGQDCAKTVGTVGLCEPTKTIENGESPKQGI